VTIRVYLGSGWCDEDLHDLGVMYRSAFYAQTAETVLGARFVRLEVGP
jgi:hypothetical protein